MTDPGLSNRLRQHSRRSGLMVGLSMAATIAVLVGGFVAIFALTLPWISDFVPLQARERTPTPPPAIVAQVEPADAGPAPTSVLNAITGNQDEAAAPAVAPEATQPPEPTETPEAFEPTHAVRNANGESINLRPEPSRDRPAIVALLPDTPLQYLNEDAPTTIPDDAPGWMRFRTEDGDEGWIRQIDAVEIDDP